MNNEENDWFLLYCKGKEEQRAVDNLKNQDIKSFFVSAPIEKIIRNKKVIKEEPLFPNYIFVKLNIKTNNFNSVRSTRGVIDFVRCGIEYIKVPISLVDNLKKYHKKEAERVFNKDDKLFINSGPFKNLDAIYQCADGLERSVVLVNILQKQSRVKIPNSNLR